ncbi:MAG: glycosyltransferase 87 family protein [Coleofasciculus sp. F4-SAH-05]
MKRFPNQWINNTTLQVQRILANYHSLLLGGAIALLSAIAFSRLAYQFARLVWLSDDFNGAIDLKLRYQEVNLWFAGEPIYDQLGSAVYPPASYTMLLPFLGYPSLSFTRWLWAITSIAALIWLAYLLINETQIKKVMPRVLLVMLLLAMYPTGDTIGNGQLTLHILVSLVAGLTLMCRRPIGWGKDLWASVLVIAALVKPTLAVPFFWIVLFVPGRVRPILMVSVGYIALALFATGFQQSDLFSLHHDWLAQGIKGAAWGTYSPRLVNYSLITSTTTTIPIPIKPPSSPPTTSPLPKQLFIS